MAEEGGDGAEGAEERLFRREDGSGICFFMRSVSTDPTYPAERFRIRSLVEKHGGKWVSPAAARGEQGLLELVREKDRDIFLRQLRPDQVLYLTSYVDNCVAEKKLVPLEPYIIKALETKKREHKYFTEEDDRTLRGLVHKHESTMSVKGEKLWHKVEIEWTGCGHTWQSLKNRYIHHILPRVKAEESEAAEIPEVQVTSPREKGLSIQCAKPPLMGPPVNRVEQEEDRSKPKNSVIVIPETPDIAPRDTQRITGTGKVAADNSALPDKTKVDSMSDALTDTPRKKRRKEQEESLSVRETAAALMTIQAEARHDSQSEIQKQDREGLKEGAPGGNGDVHTQPEAEGFKTAPAAPASEEIRGDRPRSVHFFDFDEGRESDSMAEVRVRGTEEEAAGQEESQKKKRPRMRNDGGEGTDGDVAEEGDVREGVQESGQEAVLTEEEKERIDQIRRGVRNLQELSCATEVEVLKALAASGGSFVAAKRLLERPDADVTEIGTFWRPEEDAVLEKYCKSGKKKFLDRVAKLRRSKGKAAVQSRILFLTGGIQPLAKEEEVADLPES